MRLDPVVVEAVAGLIWLAVGTVGIGADGTGTVLLAFGIAAAAYVLVQNRRHGPGVFDAARSGELLRLGAGTVAALVVASILFGIIGFSAFLVGLAALLCGGAFLILARSTGQRPTRWLGIALIVLGLISAFTSTQETTGDTGGFVSQGLVGLVAGVLLIASAADRVGLLAMLRDRIR